MGNPFQVRDLVWTKEILVIYSKIINIDTLETRVTGAISPELSFTETLQLINQLRLHQAEGIAKDAPCVILKIDNTARSEPLFVLSDNKTFWVARANVYYQ